MDEARESMGEGDAQAGLFAGTPVPGKRPKKNKRGAGVPDMPEGQESAVLPSDEGGADDAGDGPEAAADSGAGDSKPLLAELTDAERGLKIAADLKAMYAHAQESKTFEHKAGVAEHAADSYGSGVALALQHIVSKCGSGAASYGVFLEVGDGPLCRLDLNGGKHQVTVYADPTNIPACREAFTRAWKALNVLEGSCA